MAFDTALEELHKLNPNERSYIRLNVLVDRFLPNGAQEQAARAVEDKQCRFCEIKKTATAEGAARRAHQMTIDEFNTKSPIDIADQYITEVNGAPHERATAQHV